MTLTNNLTTKPINSPLLVKRILLGAGIALIAISVFVFGVPNPRPEWGKLWMIRPLLVTPLVGGFGGACTYVVSAVLNKAGWQKALAITLNILGYFISLWMGIVLGLVGTMWH